jgi:hypothetical protein
MCEHHQLIPQCRLDNVKTVGQKVEGHGSVFVRHETCNSRNGHENISHSIMQGYPFPTMRTTKKVYPHRIQRLATNVMGHPKEMGKTNQVCNAMEKTSEGK